MLTMTVIGPRGASSAIQTNSPGLIALGGVPGGNASFAPQNGTAATVRTRTTTATNASHMRPIRLTSFDDGAL
jgi:hypothetical protein